MCCHQCGKWFVVLPTNNSVLGHQDLLKEGLVEQLPFGRLGSQVGLVAVLSPRCGQPDRSFGLLDVGVGVSQRSLCLGDRRCDADLLDFE